MLSTECNPNDANTENTIQQCIICYEQITKSSSIYRTRKEHYFAHYKDYLLDPPVYTRRQWLCGHHVLLHADCAKVWFETQGMRRRLSSCPMCCRELSSVDMYTLSASTAHAPMNTRDDTIANTIPRYYGACIAAGVFICATGISAIIFAIYLVMYT